MSLWRQLQQQGYVVLRQLVKSDVLRRADAELKSCFAHDSKGHTLAMEELKPSTRELCTQIRKEADENLQRLFAQDIALSPLPQYQWVRTKVSRTDKTRPHCDFFYFQKKTAVLQSNNDVESTHCTWCEKRLDKQALLQTMNFSTDLERLYRCCSRCADSDWHAYTCWIPFVDLSDDRGDHMLQWIPGSHQWKGGWVTPESMRTELPTDFRQKRHRVRWRTAKHFRVGDVVLFHWKLVHRASSGKSQTHQQQKLWRSSTDLRYICSQGPASTPCEKLLVQVYRQWSRWVERREIMEHHLVNAAFLFRLLSDVSPTADELTKRMVRSVPNCSILFGFLDRVGRWVLRRKKAETKQHWKQEAWYDAKIPSMSNDDAWVDQTTSMVFSGMDQACAEQNWHRAVGRHLDFLERKKLFPLPLHITYFLTHVILVEIEWGLKDFDDGDHRKSNCIEKARQLLLEDLFMEKRLDQNYEAFWEKAWVLMLLYNQDTLRYPMSDQLLACYLGEYEQLSEQIRSKQWILDDWFGDTQLEYMLNEWSPDGVEHFYHSHFLAAVFLRTIPLTFSIWMKPRVPRSDIVVSYVL